MLKAPLAYTCLASAELAQSLGRSACQICLLKNCPKPSTADITGGFITKALWFHFSGTPIPSPPWGSGTTEHFFSIICLVDYYVFIAYNNTPHGYSAFLRWNNSIYVTISFQVYKASHRVLSLEFSAAAAAAGGDSGSFKRFLKCILSFFQVCWMLDIPPPLPPKQMIWQQIHKLSN